MDCLGICVEMVWGSVLNACNTLGHYRNLPAICFGLEMLAV